MKKDKTARKASSNRMHVIPGWGEQRELLRELRDLLDANGPAWYTEELATRLNNSLAKSEYTTDKTTD